MTTPKDNSTFTQKAALRRECLRWLDQPPVVMETHGGAGVLYEACYADLPCGVVFEKDPVKADILGQQRPTWSVYEANCIPALQAGVGSHLAVNFLDCDPYGEPHPVLDAFLTSGRPHPETLVIVVNDGLRQKLQMRGAWSVGSMHTSVQKYGNNLYPIYLKLCRELLEQKASQAGYTVTRFVGYYCGYMDNMTHYAALLKRGSVD